MSWKSESSRTCARGRGLAEHEAQRQPAERVEERDDGDGEEGRVRAVASRRLAVAADPVADSVSSSDAEPERLRASPCRRSTRRRTPRTPRDRAAQQCHRDERAPAGGRASPPRISTSENTDTCEDRREEDEHRGLQAVDHFDFRLAHEDDHRAQRAEVDEQLDLDLLVGVDVDLAHARHGADRDSAREDEVSGRTSSPAVTSVSSWSTTMSPSGPGRR